MDQAFASLRGFDFANSDVFLWIFKRSATPAHFSARYAQTDGNLNSMLQAVATSEIARLTEFAAYTHLAQTNENSCLAMPVQGGDFENLKVIIDRPEPDWRVRNIRDLKNATGYAAKFVNNGRTVYAVKRSTTNWKTSYLKTHINLIFQNGELSAAEDTGFSIEKVFDFFSCDDALFIVRKQAFESAMQHRISYSRAFAQLQGSQAFTDLFTDLAPIVNYVGTNSIQLRRMARIEERALFARPGFLAAVQAANARRGWGLNFDANGRLVPCDQTARTIMQVLLDHRLLSEITDLIYDVPDATQV